MPNRDYFRPDAYYHIFNRTNNKERLFRNDDNKLFFLKRTRELLSPFFRVYAYCLLYNHFHFLVRTRTIAEVTAHLSDQPTDKLIPSQRKWLNTATIERTDHAVYELALKRLFTSYAKAYNKAWNREGNLFNRPYKRKLVQTEGHLLHLLYYIHTNPVKHGGDPDFTRYVWSSYQAHIQQQTSWLEQQTVLKWFGSRDHFITFHGHSTGHPELMMSSLDDLANG